MIKFFLMISRRGKVRLAKWFTPISHPEKVKTIKQITSLVLNRNPYQCNFIQWEDYKLIYKRLPSAYLDMLAYFSSPARSKMIMSY